MIRIFLAVVLLLTSAASVAAEEIPMWAGVKKTQQMAAADNKLIAEAEKHGGRKAAAARANDLGWAAIAKGDPNMAVRRFNQAWLLDPDNPNVYWGFAVATGEQGKPLSVVFEYFGRAERGYSRNKRAMSVLLTDQGKVLGKRRMYAEAILKFEKALSLDRNNREARMALVATALATGDKDSAKKYAK